MALECLFPGPGRGIPDTVLSSEVDARTMPSGEKATALTESLWLSSVCFQIPVVAFQSRTVLSYEVDARTLPSGEKATALTEPLWPSSVCFQVPIVAFQSRTVLSAEADANSFDPMAVAFECLQTRIPVLSNNRDFLYEW